jgi:ABC-3C protein
MSACSPITTYRFTLSRGTQIPISCVPNVGLMPRFVQLKYAYEDLSETQFEDLIVLLCQRLLGASVQKFSKGPDGGRDAKFHGTAELHPSTAAPWVGITIVQAKHTNGYNRNFWESDFYSKTSANTVLGEEIPRIRNLRANKLLDHYMLFANRRLAGNAETEISSYISRECNIPAASIYLCGAEQMEIWFKRFSDVPRLANLDLVDSPLIVSSDDLADVVNALAEHKGKVVAVLDDPPVPRVTYATKNSLNNMSVDYAARQRRLYLKETAQVHTFLAAPENSELLKLYESVVNEFELRILSKRKEYQTFDEVMEYLTRMLFRRDVVLNQNKRLTRAVLFYMYWNCDIGKASDAETN